MSGQPSNRTVFRSGMLNGLSKTILLAALIALPLVINGYPIFFNDSGTYLQAFQGIASFSHPPVDRPIFYSIYLYVFRTAFHTNTAAILFQCLIFAYVAIRFGKLARLEGLGLRLVLFLILPFSYLAVMACALMPDIWMPIAVLAAYLIFHEPGPRKLVYFLAIVASVAFAPANGVIIALSVGGFFIAALIAKISMPKRWASLAIVAFAVLAGQGAVSCSNYFAYKTYAPIVSGSAFLYATLSREKLAGNALADECTIEDSHNSICIAISDYRNLAGNTLLWDPRWGHPIQDPGNQGFLSKVNLRILKTHSARAAEYFLKNTATTLAMYPSNLDQLYLVKYNTTHGAATWLNQYGDMTRFSASSQQTSDNVFRYLALYRLLLAGLLIASAWKIVCKKRYAEPALLGFLIWGLLFVVVNAAITGGLSLPDYRFNVRVADLMVLMLFCLSFGARSNLHRHER